MAATNINRVVITGNLTRDPELRSTPSGTSVCSLRVAVNSRRKDERGQWVDKPNYFDVTVWGAQGENCAQYLQGPPRRGRRPAQLARVGGQGRRQAAVGGYHCRLSPVPGLPRRGAGATAVGSRRRATSQPTPPTSRRGVGWRRRRPDDDIPF